MRSTRSISKKTTGLQIVVLAVQIDAALTTIDKLQAVPIQALAINEIVGAATLKATTGNGKILVRGRLKEK